jgi:hypothetical protein
MPRRRSANEVLMAIATLADHAEGRVAHLGTERCPGDGADQRDPRCPVCQALQILRPREVLASA